MPKIKIALLLGGISGEREVSLKTGEKIYENLDKNKYEVKKYDPKTDLIQFIKDAGEKKFDLVFPALHGPFGEDGKIQGLMEMLQIPYVFSDCLSSALAMDKDKTKTIVEKAGLKVARGVVIKNKDEFEENKFDYPIIIKPLELGSSVGMTYAKNKTEAEEGIKEALKFNNKVLVEKYIRGRELTVPIIGNNPPVTLPVIEIKPKNSEWFDFKAKYEAGATEEICPAEIPESIEKKIKELSIKAYNSIGCRDLARADFIWNENDREIYFLEINTIPGMTETSLVPQSAQVAGINFSELLDKLINEAFKRK
jgi:D-alanine-D-alanine ligase